MQKFLTQFKSKSPKKPSISDQFLNSTTAKHHHHNSKNVKDRHHRDIKDRPHSSKDVKTSSNTLSSVSVKQEIGDGSSIKNYSESDIKPGKHSRVSSTLDIPKQPAAPESAKFNSTKELNNNESSSKYTDLKLPLISVKTSVKLLQEPVVKLTKLPKAVLKKKYINVKSNLLYQFSLNDKGLSSKKTQGLSTMKTQRKRARIIHMSSSSSESDKEELPTVNYNENEETFIDLVPSNVETSHVNEEKMDPLGNEKEKKLHGKYQGISEKSASNIQLLWTVP